MPRSSRESGDLTLGWSEPDGEPSPSPRSTPTPLPSSPSGGPVSRTSGTLPLCRDHGPTCPNVRTILSWAEGPLGARMEYDLTPPVVESTTAFVFRGSQPPSGPAASPARTSASPGSDEAWSQAPAPTSPTPSSTLWSATDLPPSSSRTYRASSPVMEARILGRSSVAWANSGMGGPTGFSTLATSECRSADGACSSSPSVLAQVLEPTAPPRFFLSARAAAGILRRASKRGRTLPTELDRALTSLAQSSPPPASDTTRTSTPSSPVGARDSGRCERSRVGRAARTRSGFGDRNFLVSPSPDAGRVRAADGLAGRLDDRGTKRSPSDEAA
jgi:hypothetical protein